MFAQHTAYPSKSTGRSSRGSSPVAPHAFSAQQSAPGLVPPESWPRWAQTPPAHIANYGAIAAYVRSPSPPRASSDSSHHAPTDSASPPDTACYDVAQDDPPFPPPAYSASAACQSHTAPRCLIHDISSTKLVALAS